jgi:hypothetical protein
MDKQTILKNIAVALKASFPKLAEEVKVLMNAVPPAPAPAPVPILAQDKKTQDGKTLSTEGDFTVGAPVMEVGVDGTKAPVADGSYVLEDGSTVVVTGGLITALNPKVEQAVPAPVPMEAQLSAHKTEVEKLIDTKLSFHAELLLKKIELLEASNKTLVQFADAVLNTPVPDNEPAKRITFEKELSTEEYNKLTNNEKRIYNEQHKK